jgi:hypothetical protein
LKNIFERVGNIAAVFAVLHDERWKVESEGDLSSTNLETPHEVCGPASLSESK